MPSVAYRLLCSCVVLLFSVSANAQEWTSWTSGNDVYDIALQGDTVWTTGGGAVVRWIGNEYTMFNPHTPDGGFPSRAGKIVVGAGGDVWVEGTDPLNLWETLNRWDGSSWQTYSPQDIRGGKQIIDFISGNDGKLWVVIEPNPIFSGDTFADTVLGGGVSYWEYGLWRNFDMSDGLGTNNPTDIAVGADGRIWVISSLMWVEASTRYDTGWTRRNIPTLSVWDDELWVSMASGLKWVLHFSDSMERYFIAARDSSLWVYGSDGTRGVEGTDTGLYQWIDSEWFFRRWAFNESCRIGRR